MLIRELYTLSTEALIMRYLQLENAQTVASTATTRRNKSIMARRNLGTIKQLAKKKTESGVDQLDCILRVLRLRASSHKEARRFLAETLAKRTLSSGHQASRPLPAIPDVAATTTITMQR